MNEYFYWHGGSWYYGPWVARCACRDWYHPGLFGYYLGFRLVLRNKQ